MSYERWIGWRYLYGGKRDKTMAIGAAFGAAVSLTGLVLVVTSDGGSSAGVLMLILGLLAAAVMGLLAIFSVFTSVSVLGVVLGVAALTAVLAVTTGFQHEFRTKVLGVNAHVTIQKPGLPFDDYKRVMDDVLKVDPSIVAIQPFIFRELLMTNGKGATAGVAIKGVDPEGVRKVLDLEQHIISGSIADIDTGIILGKQLAAKLSVSVGDDVTVVVPLSNVDMRTMRLKESTPRTHKFKVVAIFYSGFDEYDRRLTYASLRVTQRLVDDEGVDDVQGIELKVADVDDAEEIGDKIAAAIGEPPFEVKDWYELNTSLFTALTMQKLALTIILTLIITVATFNMVSALTMMVTDKTGEVAILKSMGAKSNSISKVFLVIGLAITGVGTLVGVGVGLVTCFVVSAYGYQLDSKVYLIDRLPIAVRPFEVLLVCGLTMVIGMIATVVPARRAAGLRPVDGLRYD
jgi:lipoprotein-releasing system permease protein